MYNIVIYQFEHFVLLYVFCYCDFTFCVCLMRWFSYRPVSAYALFFRDTQAAIKGQNPNASFGEVSKIVASMWDGLDVDHKNVSDLTFLARMKLILFC